MSRMKNFACAGVLVFAGLTMLDGASRGVAQSAQGNVGPGPNDARIQAEVTKALDNKRFKDVKSSVQDGVVKLTGTVELYSAKLDADDRAHHRQNVKGVENQIEVAGPDVDDMTLRNKLAEKLAYDRVGYGTTAFNAFTIGVEKGVVTLGGTAYGPTDKDSALSLAENYPGVKDVIDNVEVAPVSPMDDRIRLAEARSIYGFPQLNKYAIDPAKPIRIAVVNGNVTLSGVVDSQSDKDVANIRANGVPGVFKVVNNLEVVGGEAEKPAK
ncbi:BON domain-containing protein [Tunturiibacter empetritectus]|uniref:Osmotically-inducible protein OsmY n=2 Tax=Tunturiibacter TaxID=3154218 RepID=A0A852VD67_9BACT|nr:BON domain-containing protein [Edaphobacter lichenicola]NYF90823.1 osmotically-inducible protein OsmY [Edaphobacter lichenicola]